MQQEQLRKAREDFDEYQRVIHNDPMIDQEAYQRKLTELRQMNLADPQTELPEMATEQEKYVTAMALAQLSIERRINGIREALIRQQGLASGDGDGEPTSSVEALRQEQNTRQGGSDAPDGDTGAGVTLIAPVTVTAVARDTPPQEPEQEKLGVIERIKRWYARKQDEKRQAAELKRQNEEERRQREERLRQQAARPQVDLMRFHNRSDQNRLVVPPEDGDVMENVQQTVDTISQLQTPSLLDRSARMTPPAPGQPIVSPQEMELMRKSGARAVGNCLTKRVEPVLRPMMNEVDQLVLQLDAQHFDYANALKQRTDQTFRGAPGGVSMNPAILAFATRSLTVMTEHLEADGLQEYVKLLYSTIRDVPVEEIKKTMAPGEEFPTVTPEMVTRHMMLITPTRGFNPILDKSDNGQDRFDFIHQSRMVMTKLESLRKVYGAARDTIPDYLAPQLNALLDAYDRYVLRISQLGGEEAARIADELTQANHGYVKPMPSASSGV